MLTMRMLNIATSLVLFALVKADDILQEEKPVTNTSISNNSLLFVGIVEDDVQNHSVEDPDFYRNPKSLAELQLIQTSALESELKRLERNNTLETSIPEKIRSHRDSKMYFKPQSLRGSGRGRRDLVTFQSKQMTGAKRSKPNINCDGGLRKIVQCKDSIPEEVCKAHLIEAGVNILCDMPKTEFFSICVESEEDAAIVRQLTDVRDMEDDPPRTLSYIEGSEVIRRLQRSEQIMPFGVDMVNAPDFWERYGKQGEGINVCVIDTGIRASHEDLDQNNMSGSDSRRFVTPWSRDGNGHGTHVSGTIAASDNGIGVVGIAPKAAVHTVRVFNSDGSFSASNLVEAMVACADANANIISMSLGGPIDTFAERMATRNLLNSGILLVAASGNGANSNNFVEYPAAYPDVMSVGAVNRVGHLGEFSTYNSFVDIVGPGVDILSLGAVNDRSYSTRTGTSMAAPHIAGVAALLWSQFPNKTPSEIRAALQSSARDAGACGRDPLYGEGIVDAMAAAAYLSGAGASEELSGCVEVKVTVTTDDFGSETFYVVTNEDGKIIFRNGPYPSSRRRSYTDSFRVQESCYNLILIDTRGNGFNNPNFGLGSIQVEYNGMQQVDFGDFGGFRETLRFGSCVTSAPVTRPTTAPVDEPTPAPVAPATERPTDSVTSAPVTRPTTAPVAPETDRSTDPPVSGPPPPNDGGEVDDDNSGSSSRCSSGETFISLSLETDRWSPSENHLYFFDSDAADDEWIWVVRRTGFRPRRRYEGAACIDLRAASNKCYKFYFFDDWGDGLASGGVTLSQNGRTVLRIDPGDFGTIFEEGSPPTFWLHEFGRC